MQWKGWQAIYACVVVERHAGESRHLDFEEQEYWEGSGEELEVHGDDEEADMRTQQELMMQHRYMMVSQTPRSPAPLALRIGRLFRHHWF